MLVPVTEIVWDWLGVLLDDAVSVSVGVSVSEALSVGLGVELTEDVGKEVRLIVPLGESDPLGVPEPL